MCSDLGVLSIDLAADDQRVRSCNSQDEITQVNRLEVIQDQQTEDFEWS